MHSPQKPKLAREDWFRVGLEALAKSGPEALKAASLARILGVTTGSFYWHFVGVAEFRSGLLEYWQDVVVGGLMRAAQASAQEPTRVLAELGKHILESGAHRYDAAIRSWGRSDPLARETVRRADELRAIFLEKALVSGGMSAKDARDRTNLIGAAWRGSQDLDGDPEYRIKLVGIAASD